jgi:hypothetical protein
MRKLIAIALSMAFVLATPAYASQTGDPHAGKSGHFRGSATPCKNSDNNPNCPPFGGG